MKTAMKTTINGQEVFFFRADGTPAENCVAVGGIDSKTGETLFYEIVGCAGGSSPNARIGGKQVYKRLLIRIVYPHIRVDDVSSADKAFLEDEESRERED